MRSIYDQIARVAETSVTVLVGGESGTGKELVAQTIHALSRRRGQPFLAVNCGAIPRELLESEMFGHEKGSFTGATRQHCGYFERTHGGTLFLDEVTEMPLELQVKLLRVLETGRFMRVGSDQVMETDVRIVAATNRVPEEAVHAGKLREDLLYRLNVFPIQVPPLRERLEDVELLAEHFLGEIGRRENQPKRFTPEALEALRHHRWPGNVRELRNAVQRAYILAEGATIDAACLPLDESGTRRESGPFLTVRVGSSIAEVERRLIYATLEQCGGRREKAAELLGVSMKTLYNRLREYQTEEAAEDARAGSERELAPAGSQRRGRRAGG
jgi:DNA-binding NtrC family response regulator